MGVINNLWWKYYRISLMLKRMKCDNFLSSKFLNKSNFIWPLLYLPCWIYNLVNFLGSIFRCHWMKPFSLIKWLNTARSSETQILLNVSEIILNICELVEKLSGWQKLSDWWQPLNRTHFLYHLSELAISRAKVHFPEVFPIVLMNFCLEMTVVDKSMTPVVVSGSSQFTPSFSGKPRIFDRLRSLYEVQKSDHSS